MKNFHLLILVLFSLLLQNCSKKKPHQEPSTTPIVTKIIQEDSTQIKDVDTLLVKQIDSIDTLSKQPMIQEEEIRNPLLQSTIHSKKQVIEKKITNTALPKQEEKIDVQVISNVIETTKSENKDIPDLNATSIQKSETISSITIKDTIEETAKVESIPNSETINTASSISKKTWQIPSKYQTMKNPTDTSDKEDLAVGKNLYAKHCKACHGKQGYGDGPKAADQEGDLGDFSSEETQSQSDGALFYKISKGREDMPNFKKKIVDDEDRWLIVNYLRTLAE